LDDGRSWGQGKLGEVGWVGRLGRRLGAIRRGECGRAEWALAKVEGFGDKQRLGVGVQNYTDRGMELSKPR